MSTRRSPLAIFIFLSLITFLCLGVMIGGFILAGLPPYAARTFGEPSPHLGITQQIRLSLQLLWQADDLSQPIDTRGEPTTFRIELGESIPVIAARLENEGFIKNASAFSAYLRYSGLDVSLQAGEYLLSPGMTAIEIAQHLQDPTPAEVEFNILSGWRAEEVAASLPTSGFRITPEEFLAAIEMHPPGYEVIASIPPGSSLEGFLFPGSYRLSRLITSDQLVTAFVENFSENVRAELINAFENHGLNVFQAVILASIVERESVIIDEMPLIASVFLNRYSIGMKLDADSTVQYALGYDEVNNTWWTNPLTREHLNVDSPYNTYLYPGLPPGPIANPGIDALLAVAYPADSIYYFFRAACDNSGTHLFAETYEEHLRNACP
jgi:UPF0755 protein